LRPPQLSIRFYTDKPGFTLDFFDGEGFATVHSCI